MYIYDNKKYVFFIFSYIYNYNKSVYVKRVYAFSLQDDWISQPPAEPKLPREFFLSTQESLCRNEVVEKGLRLACFAFSFFNMTLCAFFPHASHIYVYLFIF